MEWSLSAVTRVAPVCETRERCCCCCITSGLQFILRSASWCSISQLKRIWATGQKIFHKLTLNSDLHKNIHWTLYSFASRSSSVARALPPVTRSEVTRTFRSSSSVPVDRLSSSSYRSTRLERWAWVISVLNLSKDNTSLRYHNSDPIRYSQYPRFQSRFYR